MKLSAKVRGGHARYLYQAADRALAYLKGHRNDTAARRELGDTPERIMANAVAHTSHLETEEELREVLAIMREQGDGSY